MRMILILILVFVLLSRSLAFAESGEFPQRLRGFWVNEQGTCDLLKKKGPAYLRSDQEWLKIAAIDVLGSIQGRYLQETPKKFVVPDGAEFSFEIQTFYVPRIIEELTLSRDGYLYDTVVGARSSGKYQRC